MEKFKQNMLSELCEKRNSIRVCVGCVDIDFTICHNWNTNNVQEKTFNIVPFLFSNLDL